MPTERGGSDPLSFMGRSATLSGLFALEAGGGFLLDVVLAAAFGLGAHSDALYAAWKLPQAIGQSMFETLVNSFMGLFAGQGDQTSGYNEAITVVASLVLPLAILFSAASVWWLPLTVPGAKPTTQLAAIPLARVLAWLIGCLALAQTFRAICYREGQLWLPSLAALIGIVAAIAFAIVAGRQQNLLLAGWGITAGVGLEALIDFLGLGLLLHWRFRPAWPKPEKLRELGAVVGAPLAGQGVQVLASAGQRALASLLPAGSITALSYANRIVGSLERFVFRGFVITTIQTVPVPEGPDSRNRVRWLTLIAIPLSGLLAFVSRPLVAIAFGRGRFVAEDVRALALTVQMYAPVIIGQALTRIPLGVAYARRRGNVVFRFLATVAVMALSGAALCVYLGLGLRSFGLGQSLALGLAAVWLYHSVWPGAWRRMWSWTDVSRLTMVALGTWLGTALVVSLAGRLTSGSRYADWLTLIGGGAGCGLCLVVAAYGVGLDEARQLLQLTRRVRR